MGTTIHTVNNITLVTLQSSPATINFISEVFEKISEKNINVDMISMSPAKSSITELSFTISDEDLIETLNLMKQFKKDMQINSIVSSVNHKISVYDENMKNTPGTAAKVFTLIKNIDADIRLITTSEVEISLLVSDADYDNVLNVLKKSFNS